jgi:hypothetical protein
MINVRNALGAGVMLASILIAPAMVATPAAAAAETVSISSTLTSVQKPCRKHKNPARCRARRGGYGGHLSRSRIGRGIGDSFGRTGIGRSGIGRSGIGHRGGGPSGAGHSRSRD